MTTKPSYQIASQVRSEKERLSSMKKAFINRYSTKMQNLLLTPQSSNLHSLFQSTIQSTLNSKTWRRSLCRNL